MTKGSIPAFLAAKTWAGRSWSAGVRQNGCQMPMPCYVGRTAHQVLQVHHANETCHDLRIIERQASMARYSWWPLFRAIAINSDGSNVIPPLRIHSMSNKNDSHDKKDFICAPALAANSAAVEEDVYAFMRHQILEARAVKITRPDRNPKTLSFSPISEPEFEELFFGE